MTKVINIRNKTRADDEVYVGRWNGGYFGNPIVVGRRCPECGVTHSLPGTTIPCYRRHVERRLARDPEFKRRVAELRGKTLVCHCKPGPCHGDVLKELADAS